MRSQATRNADIIAAQQRRSRVRETLLAVPVYLVTGALIAYAIAGLLTPLPSC